MMAVGEGVGVGNEAFSFLPSKADSFDAIRWFHISKSSNKSNYSKSKQKVYNPPMALGFMKLEA
jgi:hypothetical protein